MKEMKREKHASYSSHNSCKSLSEELHDYYEESHRSHLRPHSHRREKERKPQEANINLPYFHGKDNVEANLDWEIRVEQQLKKKSTSKYYGSHSYPKKDQGQGILRVTPSKSQHDKGKTIEKEPLKASMHEKTSSMKCFKCLGRGQITSKCPTKKTMIRRGQDIYSSRDEATTSPSSSESEEAKGEESSEEIYPQEEGQPKKTMIRRGQDIYSSQDEATTSPSSSECEEAKGEKSSEEIYPQEEGQPLMVKEECTKVEGMMQSYPQRVLDRRLQEARARATKEGPRVLMNLRDFIEAQRSSLHRSPISKLPSPELQFSDEEGGQITSPPGMPMLHLDDEEQDRDE
ncbi:hypothetical protein HKD37_06G016777 [Glycine soja]